MEQEVLKMPDNGEGFGSDLGEQAEASTSPSTLGYTLARRGPIRFWNSVVVS